MNSALGDLLSRYKLESAHDHRNALAEVMQQVALLGLWRTKFFERAAFYGGTALRIFHGLGRFSEDLDFSLITREDDFPLDRYLAGVEAELKGFGFEVEVRLRQKRHPSPILTGFAQGLLRPLLLTIRTPDDLVGGFHPDQRLKLKIEVDGDPPGGFETENQMQLVPIPHSVRIFRLSDMLAGKLHALLTRRNQTRVKGRDWYDLVWFVGRRVPVHLEHLQRRLIHSGHRQEGDDLTIAELKRLMADAVAEFDLEAAMADVAPFLQDRDALALWSKDFFSQLIADRLETV